MAHISGVELPKEKRIVIGLTYIYGIGKSRAEKILEKAGIDENIKVKDLNTDQEKKLRAIILEEYVVEGDLRTQKAMDIKRLMEINCYRGIRHKTNLPVRGQRTHTNARTRKGRKR
ncbi:MAG: 30S ribosomal protein S13 [Candidatus Cloacimonetes bacterium]|nr:30S ribosomal protein S13 [Candidatus Cloacimonadota bacterium]